VILPAYPRGLPGARSTVHMSGRPGAKDKLVMPAAVDDTISVYSWHTTSRSHSRLAQGGLSIQHRQTGSDLHEGRVHDTVLMLV